MNSAKRFDMFRMFFSVLMKDLCKEQKMCATAENAVL